MFDEQLLDVLVCPKSKGKLILSDDSKELISRTSGLAYPIEDGIPMLLLEKARPLTPDEVLNHE